jgi:hypothetical protein
MLPTDSPLRECWDKIGRASEHLKSLTDEFRTYIDAEPFRTIGRYAHKEAKYLLEFRDVKAMPTARWALIVGDCVHNARAALDYIAWRCAGSCPTDWNTSFPILDSPNRGRFKSHTKRVHEGAATAIKALQPYKRTHPKEQPLWLLEELDARDKHKLLTVIQGYLFGAEFTIKAPTGAKGVPTLHRDRSLKNGTVFAEVQFPMGTPKIKVKVNASLMPDIVFEESLGRNLSVFKHLNDILLAVERVVSHFDQLLAANPQWLKGRTVRTC